MPVAGRHRSPRVGTSSPQNSTDGRDLGIYQRLRGIDAARPLREAVRYRVRVNEPSWYPVQAEEECLVRIVVSADFDEVAVGVAEVDRSHRTECAIALDRTQLDRDVVTSQSIEHVPQGDGRDQAEVGRSLRGLPGSRVEGVIGLMQVDLLFTEPKCGGSIRRVDTLEVEALFIEVARLFDRPNGEDEVVDTVDHVVNPSPDDRRPGKRTWRGAPRQALEPMTVASGMRPVLVNDSASTTAVIRVTDR